MPAWQGRLTLVASAVLAAGCGTGSRMAATATLPEPAAATDSTTATPTPATAVPPGAAQLLASLPMAPEADSGVYSRDAFGYPEAGTDSRGCNTRARVLIRDSTVPAQVAYPGCKVVAGRWTDSYTGTTYEDPTKVSIDHLVPLREAARSGAATWPAEKLVAFGNDIGRVEALKVIGGSGNASKGDKDPAKWKPPLRSAWPTYAQAWLTVKVAYELTADQAEADALRAMLAVNPSATAPTPQPEAAPTSSTSTSTTTSGPAPAAPATTGAADVYYPSCAAVRAAGKAPLHRGDPGYRQGLDGDSDGSSCED